MSNTFTSFQPLRTNLKKTIFSSLETIAAIPLDVSVLIYAGSESGQLHVAMLQILLHYLAEAISHIDLQKSLFYSRLLAWIKT